MVLHSEDRKFFVANTFHGPIVQIEVGDFETSRSGHLAGLTFYRKAVVLGGDKYLPGAEIPNRVITASVAVGHFDRAATKGESQQLVPQADAESREARLGQFLDGSDGVSHCRRVAGAIGEEQTGGFQLFHLGGSGSRWDHRNLTP